MMIESVLAATCAVTVKVTSTEVSTAVTSDAYVVAPRESHPDPDPVLFPICLLWDPMLLLVACAVKLLLVVVVNPENHATPPPVRNRADFTPAVLDVNHLNENSEIPFGPRLPPGMVNDGP